MLIYVTSVKLLFSFACLFSLCFLIYYYYSFLVFVKNVPRRSILIKHECELLFKLKDVPTDKVKNNLYNTKIDNKMDLLYLTRHSWGVYNVKPYVSVCSI